MLDQNEKRTPIRLKLKTLNFITYVWQENNVNGLCLDCENTNENTNEAPKNVSLEKICHFLTSEEKLYSERTHPFVEADSLQWIEQVMGMLNAFKTSCENLWKEDEASLTMLKWVKHSGNFVESQIIDEKDEDVKEMYLNLQLKIKNVLSIDKNEKDEMIKEEL